MAVEAQHLHLFETTSTRECVGNQSMYNAQMGFFDDSPVFAADGYAMVDASTSCVTASNNGGVSTRKRPRDSTDVTRHMVEYVDNRLVAQHVERSRAEMMEGRIRFAGHVVALVNDRVSKRLKAKDEEIEQLKKLNWALEEKIKTMLTENQVWQYLAQTNEATANALRANLEHVLQLQQVGLGEQKLAADAAADDAESCCGDNLEDLVGTSGATADPKKKQQQLCRSCSAHEPSVLLLPCRHLCLCTACARATDVCPICNYVKTGSVNVNLC
ncbi:putative BOI-related E3 ubiquitin-protein ligase 3 [Iris pallida]|uniref:BOI-related E3 ubiquitin-protein ligase 3 n=1 Tax=Iris pallida TaxID=29817 RepID=A0AAX6GW17_IRIPA|nr:putative BOI-related E3 ubiquitin-protein ligase 3 [Iris pallida]